MVTIHKYIPFLLIYYQTKTATGLIFLSICVALLVDRVNKILEKGEGLAIGNYLGKYLEMNEICMLSTVSACTNNFIKIIHVYFA